jgi:hypothetical protein
MNACIVRTLPFSPLQSIQSYFQSRFNVKTRVGNFSFSNSGKSMLSFNNLNSHTPSTKLSLKELHTAISLATMLTNGEGTEFSDAYDGIEEPFNPAIRTAVYLLHDDQPLLHDLVDGRNELRLREEGIDVSGTAFRDALRGDSPVSCKSIPCSKRIALGMKEALLSRMTPVDFNAPALTLDEVDQDLEALKKKKKRKPKKKKNKDEAPAVPNANLPGLAEKHWLTRPRSPVQAVSHLPPVQAVSDLGTGTFFVLCPSNTPIRIENPSPVILEKQSPAIVDKSDFLPESLRNPQAAVGKRRSTQSLPQLSKKQQQKAAKRISVAAKNSAATSLPPVISPQVSNSPTIVAYSESQSSSLSSDDYQDAETSLAMDDLPIPARSLSATSKPTTPQPYVSEEMLAGVISPCLSPIPAREIIDIPSPGPASISNMIYFGQVGVTMESPSAFRPAARSSLSDDNLFAEMDHEEVIKDMFDERMINFSSNIYIGWLSALGEQDVQVYGF